MTHAHPPHPSPVALPPLNGVLVLDKPANRGFTSMHLCRIVKRRLMNAGYPKRTKVGHAGTLDPLASGVMVVLVGRATRLCDTLMAGEKRYTAGIDLSSFSNTDDLEGVLTAVEVREPPSRVRVEEAVRGFVGEIQQRPPVYSAMQVGGKRAYDLARDGRPPVLALRPVVIHSIDVLGYEFPRVTLDVRCGKGTYIRSLARDLGAALGTGGHLAALRRTASCPFTIEMAMTVDELPDPLSAEDLRSVEGG